ncbi:MAG: sugar O-acetyltransferase [Oleispira sp.]
MVIHKDVDQTSEEDQLITERMKMRSGLSFNSLDIELRLLREKSRLACGKYNAHPSKGNFKHISRLFNKLSTAVIEPGFQCDYGGQISLGDNFYANFNCVFLDSAAITIGDDVMLGPGVHIYTVDHPRDALTRRAGGCIAKPVVIGNGVWIGGGAKILPGVTIGENAIIGANAVVTKDVAADSRFLG